MKRVALAGGIGAGKSVASERLRTLGFHVIDADVVAREVVSVGRPAYVALRDAFGDAILDERGDIDRAFLADLVFHDPSALRRLNAITHPPIGEEIRRQLSEARGPATFVALPLFVAEHRRTFSLDAAWAIQVDPALALTRLIGGRHLSEEDARSRLATQMSNDERAALVDLVLWNSGTIEQLYGALDDALTTLGLVRD